MRLNFRQGIVRYKVDVTGGQAFLWKVGDYVKLIANDQQTLIAFAQGNKDYLFAESNDVENAWGPFPNTGPGYDYWLYWDINRVTGVRTFGFTTLQPVFSPTAPAHPTIGQMWWNPTKVVWTVWQGSSWVEVVRVFAAKLEGGMYFRSMSINAPIRFDGTQVGLSIGTKAGSLIYDDAGKPLFDSTRRFFTTEDAFTTGLPTHGSLRINSILIPAQVRQPIAAYQVVKYYDYNEVVPATPFTEIRGMYGIIEEDGTTEEVVNIVMEGVIANETWDWPTAGVSVNTPLYINSTGEIVVDPVIPNQVAVGAVIGPHEILFRPGLFVDTEGAVPDHGDLTGLTDDDHPQYHDDARGDIRYYTQVQLDGMFLLKSDVGHTHLHSTLTGLGADDHPQYHDDVRGDVRYYTKPDIDTFLAGKSDVGHMHSHGALLDLTNDDHPQYLTEARGNLLYSLLGHTHPHGDLTGLDQDDHLQYFNQTRGDARYALVGHTHPGTNLGTGEPVYVENMQFKTLVAGSNVTITSTGTEVTIEAAGGGGSGCCDWFSESENNVELNVSSTPAPISLCWIDMPFASGGTCSAIVHGSVSVQVPSGNSDYLATPQFQLVVIEPDGATRHDLGSSHMVNPQLYNETYGKMVFNVALIGGLQLDTAAVSGSWSFYIEASETTEFLEPCNVLSADLLVQYIPCSMSPAPP